MKKEGSLNHIEIYVNNLDKSYKFWNWFLKELGYSEFQKWDDGFSMILDSIYIVFVQTSKKYLKWRTIIRTKTTPNLKIPHELTKILQTNGFIKLKY
jgi:catechol 2,3-dioxygenase-like lactoylglutathione lyase family enzyme